MRRIKTAEALLLLAKNHPIDYAHENGAWMFDIDGTPMPTPVNGEDLKQKNYDRGIECSDDEYVLIEHTDCK